MALVMVLGSTVSGEATLHIHQKLALRTTGQIATRLEEGQTKRMRLFIPDGDPRWGDRARPVPRWPNEAYGHGRLLNHRQPTHSCSKTVDLPGMTFLSRRSTPTLILLISSPFRLIMRQQPEIARACGFGERDRRVIDPPPILQLELGERELAQSESDDSRSPVHVVQASLWDEDGREDITILAEPTKKMTRRLVGTLVSSGAVVRDDRGIKGCFFTFADLSCRTPGRCRIHFSLVCLDPRQMQPGACAPIVASILSDVVVVFLPKDFPGMKQPTALTQALKSQGVSVPAKKSKPARPSRERPIEDGADSA